MGGDGSFAKRPRVPMLLKVGKGLGMQMHSTCHLHHVYVGLVDMSHRSDVFVSHNDRVSPGLPGLTHTRPAGGTHEISKDPSSDPNVAQRPGLTRFLD